MKLACLRCKRKKIKCDKGEPICHQCITAKAECQYVERRQRPRLVQQRVAVHHLNQRLELLEKHISGAGDEQLPSAPPPLSRPEVTQDTISVPSPETCLVVDDGQDSWIYRLATDTRRNFQVQTTPVVTPTPRIDNAMMSLNEALDDLGKLRVRTETLKVDLRISPADSRACIDAFADLMRTMVVPDVFGVSMDIKLLRALPDVINSPYVSIDPGAHVFYYNALYYGLQQIHGPGAELTQKAYLKILEAVPAWLEVATETTMDGHTAALTAWTAINNHDYQLSWKFHCKSCQYVKLKGIDQLDTTPAKSFEEEDQREAFRYLYWHILSIDTLFRLFYGKPTVVRWAPNRVRPPAIFRSNNMHPSKYQVTICIVWVRYTLMTAEILHFIDSDAPHRCDGIVSQKVDQFCLQMEELLDEWKLEILMNAEDTTNDFRCLLADHIMNIYAIMIGMQRLVKKAGPGRSVDSITLRAARKVVSIILDFHMDPNLTDKTKTIFDYFITFYPFCAVFSLYEYVLACTNPDDCEDDIQALENIGIVMAQACILRRDFLPFAKTITALNKVSRTLQDERRRESTTSQLGKRDHNTSQDITPPRTTLDTFHSLVASELPDFDTSAFTSFPEFSISNEGNLHPFGFVRALENDFMAGNWHDNWWDLNGGANEG